MRGRQYWAIRCCESEENGVVTGYMHHLATGAVSTVSLYRRALGLCSTIRRTRGERTGKLLSRLMKPDAAASVVVAGIESQNAASYAT